MAYTILNTDGTTLLLLADGQVDKSATSLTLIGKNYASYGQELNNNLVRLLANSASTTGSPPRSPLKGQLWYDTTLRRLKVYDNGFKAVGAVAIATSQPASLQTGDLWFDSTNHQLKIYSSGFVYTVGPGFPSTIGSGGFILPSSTIKDQEGDAKNVILLKSYGETVGLMYYDITGSKSSFEMNLSDKATFAPHATTSTVVSGLTIIGDLNVSGRLSNNYLSMNVDLDVVGPSPNNDAMGFPTDDGHSSYGAGAKNVQNPAIASLLNYMFPPNATTATSTTTVMAGVLPGTQARVLCKYSLYAGNPYVSGYQVRVFKVQGTSPASWQPFYYTTATVGAYNVLVNYIPMS